MDILINRTGDKIITRVYRKPTFTGVYTHYLTFLPSVYKFGLLSTLLYRYFSIFSNYALFHLEVTQFEKNILNEWLSFKFNRSMCEEVFRQYNHQKAFKIQCSQKVIFHCTSLLRTILRKNPETIAKGISRSHAMGKNQHNI